MIIVSGKGLLSDFRLGFIYQKSFYRAPTIPLIIEALNKHRPIRIPLTIERNQKQLF